MSSVTAVIRILILMLAVTVCADEARLAGGHRVEGETRAFGEKTGLEMKAAWSDDVLRVKAGQVQRIALDASEKSLVPDIIVGLRNGYQLPCRLGRISEQGIGAEMADGTMNVIPWERVSSLMFAQEEKVLYSSVADGWSPKGWSGETNQWEVSEGCLRLPESDTGEKRCEFALGEKPNGTRVRFRFVMATRVDVEVAKQGLGDKTLDLAISADETPDGLGVSFMDSDGEHSVNLPFQLLPGELEFVLEYAGNEVVFVLSGVPVLKCAIPDGYRPMLGLGGVSGALKELSIVVGRRFPEPAEPKNPEVTTVYLANGDVVSGQEIKLQEQGVQGKIYGTFVNVPWKNVTAVLLPRRAASPSAQQNGQVEMRSDERILGVGRLTAITGSSITLQDEGGAAYVFPRANRTILAFGLTEGEARTPEEVLNAFCSAIQSGKWKAARDCVLPVSGEVFDGLQESFSDGAQLEVAAKITQQQIHGPIADLGAQFKVRARESKEAQWEESQSEGSIRLLRLDGRWRIQLNDQLPWEAAE